MYDETAIRHKARTGRFRAPVILNDAHLGHREAVSAHVKCILLHLRIDIAAFHSS